MEEADLIQTIFSDATFRRFLFCVLYIAVMYMLWRKKHD